MKILLNLIATGKYKFFLDEILKSADEYFFPGEEVSVVIHSEKNHIIDGSLDYSGRINLIWNYIEAEPWPYPTLKRFSYFLITEDIMRANDYVFYIDVDSKFIGKIDRSILPSVGMIGTIHPCLYEGCGTPERNPHSKACIPTNANNRYFCGGFIGGSSVEFIFTSKYISSNIEDDHSKGIIAIWHDESHINRFFYDNPPEVILDHPFAIAENTQFLSGDHKILFLDKNNLGGHNFFRS
jgi:hypothetical protein